MKLGSNPVVTAEEPLFLELLSLERLIIHAGSLASRHEVSTQKGKELLLPRLADNEALLVKASEILNAAVRNKHRISPAGEWLLDNFHVIEEQIQIAKRHLPQGYSRGLPHLTNSLNAGLPRVYDIALQVIAHVDGRVDNENISAFVTAYQKIKELTLGELWAIPIMLRLALIENLRRVAARVIAGMNDRSEANRWANHIFQFAENDPRNLILGVADLARANTNMSTAFVAELVRRLQGQNPSLDIPLAWIEQRVAENGLTIPLSIQLESQHQASNQVSIGASIGSLRQLGSTDWRLFVESMNAVEQILRKDPAGIYAQMDFATRDRYRHVIEDLSLRCSIPESAVAESALSLAEAASKKLGATHTEAHVGSYLSGNGLLKLKKTIAFPRLHAFQWGLANFRVRLWIHILLTLGLTSLFSGLVGVRLEHFGMPWAFVVLCSVLVFASSSQVVVNLLNWFLTLLVKPHVLPRLDFSKGIPTECRTLVAVPTLLSSLKNVDALLEALEVRYLANRDENLHFALVTDFTDAPTQCLPKDAEIVEAARVGIERLNTKYPRSKASVFFLLHRNRVWNAREKVWMGYERKRGKLDALNSLLRPHKNSSSNTNRAHKSFETENTFSETVGSLEILPGIKYVITLDTDTQLPRESAQKLVGTMAHPLNKPVFNDAKTSVVSGYGILQPRVGVSLPSSQKSWFVRIYGGDAGVDPYTNAVSDVYQDVFGEGSFIGKGIYDVDAMQTVLGNVLPENLILSHDLLEGCYTRSGLVTDVILYEDYPSRFEEDVKRRQRWTRGDWQIIFWLFPRVPGSAQQWRKNPISTLSKWKILDNLRRSLVPIATTTIFILSWFLLPNSWFLPCLLAASIALPPLLTSLAEVLRKPPEVAAPSHLASFFQSLWRQGWQAALALAFLPLNAFVSLDAIVRVLLRLSFSRRGLLEWNSMATSRRDEPASIWATYRVLFWAPSISACLFVLLYFKNQDALVQAVPLLLMWFISPCVAYFLSVPILPKDLQLNSVDLSFLSIVSRKTWRFFEVFVSSKDNWLPPDNVQEYPTQVVAHRTSPTNLGLGLVANLTAYDFGYVSSQEMARRIRNAFTSMDKLERFRGHFYNWYDTQSLMPLLPLYVSTVDSGNLSGLLLTLKPGLQEVVGHPVVPPQAQKGLQATLATLVNIIESDPALAIPSLSETRARVCDLLSQWISHIERQCKTLPEMTQLLQDCRQNHRMLVDALIPLPSSELQWWGDALQNQIAEGLHEPLHSAAPWAFWNLNEVAQSVPEFMRLQMEKIPNWNEVAQVAQNLKTHASSFLPALNLEQLSQAEVYASSHIKELEGLAAECEHLAEFEYDFLYDKTRHLLTIGYNVNDHRRDSSCYDLLASEARLCSYVGIAQGHLPQEHWFALGRLLTASRQGPTLLSWSGSMFEYLMPLLIMPSFKGTLLDQTYHTAVKRQIAYGKKLNLPWGISESGYNTTDVHLNYQYRAFGLPGLGFKRGLADDLVVAPYASVMALMVEPQEACANLMRLDREGFSGAYGFYEAIDYTPVRLPLGQTYAVVKSFMAHHQGMSFLSLGFLLQNQKMQKRFQSDPQFLATELLLHERVPTLATVFPYSPEKSAAGQFAISTHASLRVVPTPNTARPEVHLLSNGRYKVMVTNSGGGYSRWNDLALTRWREDPTSDNWGTFCYVKDVSTGKVWSAAHQPTLVPCANYEAIFQQAKAEFRRRDNDIEIHTEITVSPEDDIELRRFTLTNHSSTQRIIELTSYAEVVLGGQAADEVHPAFSNLFVQTEIVRSSQAILCTRRPRSQKEKTPTMVHLMAVHGAVVGEMSYETDRSQFLGRGRSTLAPAAFELPRNSSHKAPKSTPLSGSDGSVLDPIVAIRCCVILEPEQTLRVHVVNGIGETREEALQLMEKYHDRHVADRVFELAWTHGQVALRQLNITEGDAQIYERLAGAFLYANPLWRPSRKVLAKNRRGQSGLWGHGISGDLPLLLLRIGSPDKIDLLRQVVQAHCYWRAMGLTVDLVVWNEDDSGYRQHLHDLIMGIIAMNADIQLVDKPGGIFVRRAEQMSDEDRILLQTVARAVITEDGGTLAEQVERRGRNPTAVVPFIPTQSSLREGNSMGLSRDIALNLKFANGLGGFSSDGREYIIASSSKHVTPAPWSNILANPYFGSVISESGQAYTWCENAHEFRLTPWLNDATADSSGEAFYLRDEETGNFWSPTPLPVRAHAPYVTRHGFGYSVFEHISHGISSELTTFVAIDAPVKIILIKIKNLSTEVRKLSVTGYCEWALGELRSNSLLHVVTERDPSTNALLARNFYHSEFGNRIAFFDLNEPGQTFTCDRSEFLGRNGNAASPAAMQQAFLSGKSGTALDACAALQTVFELGENEEREFSFVLGVGRDLSDTHLLIRRFRGVTNAHQVLDEVKEHWRGTLGAVQIQTPDDSINILANGWLLYQVLACRIWARSGYSQSGGAFGFRDQLQDSMAVLHAEPELLRAHLLRCAARQFREGDVQHWWHPPSGRGVRTHFSDDYLWLPLAASRYVLATGDTGVLEERVKFIEGRQVKPDEEGYMDLPSISEDSATLYEHCVLALERGFHYGVHGLPLMGCGDWNDGMNLVGEHGKGESVWLAFFLCDVLASFVQIAELKNDAIFTEKCRSEIEFMKQNIEKNAWDGQWYKRAFFDNGDPLGSSVNEECQIDSLPQSWSVLSGIGDPERSHGALAEVNNRLVDREAGIIKLFDPPFDKSALNPGYIKGYVPGVRENGGQYTHAAIWTAMAFAKIGNAERAFELLGIINPINHAQTAKEVAVYKVEPYVMAADVYAVNPHTGRGGWTWYTGSAAWMYRLILESLLGLKLLNNTLTFAPCVPITWESFHVTYCFGEAVYKIKVILSRKNALPSSIVINGETQKENELRLLHGNAEYEVVWTVNC